jgi:hypothetical protein
VGADAVDPHLAFGWADLAVDQLQEGGLAGAAGAHQKGELTRQQLEMNVIQGDASAIGSRDGGKLDDWAHFSVSGNGELQRILLPDGGER